MGVAIRDTAKDSKPRGKSDRGNLKEILFNFVAPCLQCTSPHIGCRSSDCRDSLAVEKEGKAVISDLEKGIEKNLDADPKPSRHCFNDRSNGRLDALRISNPPINFRMSVRSDLCAAISLKTLMILIRSKIPRLFKNAHFQYQRNTTAGCVLFSAFAMR
jgi:hypothetical protein